MELVIEKGPKIDKMTLTHYKKLILNSNSKSTIKINPELKFSSLSEYFEKTSQKGYLPVASIFLTKLTLRDIYFRLFLSIF